MDDPAVGKFEILISHVVSLGKHLTLPRHCMVPQVSQSIKSALTTTAPMSPSHEKTDWLLRLFSRNMWISRCELKARRTCRHADV
jgi:hypothetical protein